MEEKVLSPEGLKRPFWALDTKETLEALNSSEDGISEEEAAKRLKIFGPNAIQEHYRMPKLKIFLGQLSSPLILALLGAGILTVFLKEWINAAVIFSAVTANAALGFWQENKAESVLELLKNFVRTNVRVIRVMAEKEIGAENLVPGDIIKVAQGSRVPADARIIFSNNLETDEAVLTGEALPEDKNPEKISLGAALGDRKSMLWSGSYVVSGFGVAAVTATGDQTEFGKIALLASERERGSSSTPLQKSISRFTLLAGLILTALAAVIFFTGLAKGISTYDMMLIAIAIAVSAVPEGLPVALAVTLALGVERLALKKGIVRKLLAAETLGRATVILTDKTGTLTEAKMELAGVYPYEELTEREVLEEAILNTDVIVENPDDAPQNWKIIGNAIDIALAKCAAMRGIIKKQVKLFEKIPFSHENKFAAIIYEAGGERMAILGAPEALLQKTGLSRQAKEEILKDVGRMASRGERILGVARGNPRDMGKSETWEFLGLVSFNDPVRKSVKGAIVRIGEAGVKTIIVTGDHQGTAEAVAREIGLIDGEGAVLTGEDLAHLNKEELKNITDKTTVFARVSPQDKFNLVNIFKEKGEVVAVTGDGVNDAPALKRADIGVALGSGTDVAKSVSDLVILDDNFETVVAAIEEGRRILKNIKKIIVYLLSDSANELFLIGGSMLMGLALPINALQILFVNFFSDSFPAIALAFEKDENELGKLNKDGHDIFDRKVKFLVLIIGALTSLLLFAIYYLMLRAGALPEIARTFIFASFAIYTLFLAFSAKNLEKNIWSYSSFSNKYLVAGSSIGILLTAAVIYIPTLQRIFQTVALSPLWLLGVLAVCFMNLLLVEASKWLFIKKIL